MAKELLGIATSAESEAVKLAAVRDALDRAGLKPRAQVELSAKPPEPWEELLGDVMAITKAQHEGFRVEPLGRALQRLEQREAADLLARPVLLNGIREEQSFAERSVWVWTLPPRALRGLQR
jgi:hypothetical protein